MKKDPGKTRGKKDQSEYELIIVGGGPAGLTAAVYAGRYNLRTLVIAEEEGGMAAEAYKICNFPSYQSIKGEELTRKMKSQVQNLGVRIENGSASSITPLPSGSGFKVNTFSGEYKAKKIVLATGQKKKQLGLENEEKFKGKGISYCATCDARFYENEKVAVLGGGNAALTSALLLSNFADQVYIIYRRDKFYRPSPAWVEQVKKNKKIETVFNSNVSELKGEQQLEAVKLDTGEELEVAGLFIEIGEIPNSGLGEDLGVKTDEKGYIKTDENQKTSLEGVFAAGDVTDNQLKQVITACAEGAVAAAQVYEELTQHRIN